MLLNDDDIQYEVKKKNLTNSFNKLLEMSVIPIVNENDIDMIHEDIYIFAGGAGTRRGTGGMKNKN